MFLLVKTAVLAEVSPVIVFISDICVSYNSTKLSLYLKFFSLSVALPKCTKFSKWYGISKEDVSKDLIKSYWMLGTSLFSNCCSKC